METLQDGQRAFVRDSIEQKVQLFAQEQALSAEYQAQVAALAKASSGAGTGTGTGAATAADSIDQITQAYDSLMASLDPAIAASQQFDEAQQTINDAMAAGVITTTDAAHAMDLLTAAAKIGRASCRERV